MEVEVVSTGTAGGIDRPVSVVLVDDHKMFVQSMARLLAAQSDVAVVALAGDAAGAMDAVREHHPDVVLMDNRLPDGRGTDVAARIRDAYPETKVVMLTADEDEVVLLAAVEAGCAGYVTKIGSIEDVHAAILAAAAGEVVMTPAMLGRLLPMVRRQPQEEGPKLSERELEVLGLLAEGMSNSAISQRLFLSTHTVRNHVHAILSKLGAHSKLEAVSLAVRRGVIRFPISDR